MLFDLLISWYEEWRYGNQGRNLRPREQENRRETSMQILHQLQWVMVRHLLYKSLKQWSKREETKKLDTQQTLATFSVMHEYEQTNGRPGSSWRC